MVDELQRSYFFRSLLDRFAQLRLLHVLSMISSNWTSGVFTESEIHIDRCSSSFQDPKGSYHWRRHSVLGLIDFEVLQRPMKRPFSRESSSSIVCTFLMRCQDGAYHSIGVPFRLRPPVLIRWYLNFSESIALRPRLRSLQLKARKQCSTHVPFAGLSGPIQSNRAR